MANNKDFIVKNAVEVGGATKVTLGDAASAGSYTVGYSISALSYDSKLGDVSGEIDYASGVAFKPDGTKMYVTSAAGTGTGDVFQYSLSTAWDVSTATYDSVSYSNGSVTNGYGLQFNDDGTKMFLQAYEDDRIYEHTLSTAWDLSTASYNNNNLYYGSQTAVSYDFVIGSNGTKLYVNNNNNYMYQYTMTTAYDLSTASYDSVSFDATTWTSGDGWHTQFNADGTRMIGVSEDDIYQFSLSTAWDISTLSFDNVSNVGGLTANVFTGSFVLKTDGTKLYQTRLGNVYQYTFGSTVTTGSFDLSTGNYFTDTPSADVEYTFSNAGDVQTVQVEVTGAQSVVGYDLANASYDSVSLTLSSPTLEDITAMQFKPDGLTCYLLPVKLSDNIRQCSLSTAWDISTATYDSGKIFDVSSQEGSPEGFAFKPDGTKLYVTGIGSDAVYQYTLSTAWDISTASYDSVSFSVSAYETTPSDIKFKPDGTRMYVSGRNYIDQYDLSTAWDLSTASYDATSSAISTVSSPYEASIRGISFNADGTSVFTAGTSNDSVQEFSLATAWDISSTLTHVVNFDTSTESLNPSFVEFGNNGTKMYVPYPPLGAIYQYSTSSSSPITITWDADIEWAGGTAPDSPAAGEKDLYTITTDDGGTTYFGVQSGDAFS
jgi:hypothetical protein